MTPTLLSFSIALSWVRPDHAVRVSVELLATETRTGRIASEGTCDKVLASSSESAQYSETACTWLVRGPTDTDNVMECNNGNNCNGNSDGWDCCASRGGRARCPRNYPQLCQKQNEHGEWACESDCSAQGSSIRPCPQVDSTQSITALLAALPQDAPSNSPAIARLLKAFRCGNVEVGKSPPTRPDLGVVSIGCEGPTDPLEVAQALFATAGFIVSATGVGLPIGAVLLMTSTIIGIWRETGDSAEAEDLLVKTVVRQAVSELKNFALERDLSEAEGHSTALRDRSREVCLMPKLKSCEDVLVTEWLRADDDARDGMTNILSDANVILETKYEVKDAADAALVTARVDLMDGLQRVWINMAFNRMELMVNAISKVHDCPDVSRWMQILVDDTMLKSEKKRLDAFAERWKPIREGMQDAVAAQQTVTVVKDVLDKGRWSYDVDNVIKATPMLMRLRSPGRKVLEEILQDPGRGIILAVVQEIAKGFTAWSNRQSMELGHPDTILPLVGALAKTLDPCIHRSTCDEYRMVIVKDILIPLAHMGSGTPSSYGVQMREDSKAMTKIKGAFVNCASSSEDQWCTLITKLLDDLTHASTSGLTHSWLMSS